MSEPIVLIGPPRAGKSTIGKLLSEHIGKQQIEMDSVRLAYYREIGYDDALAGQLYRNQGFWSLYRYWKPFEVHAVERVLADRPDAVIDFGAGHSVHENPESLERVRIALADVRYVILLLPSPDPTESLKVLSGRDPSFEGIAPGFSEHCLTHPSNLALAKFTVYTASRTPEETCDEICGLLRSGAPSVSSGARPRAGPLPAGGTLLPELGPPAQGGLLDV